MIRRTLRETAGTKASPDIQAARDQSASRSHTRPPRGTEWERITLDGVLALRIRPPVPVGGATLLHVHGGGYRLGSAARFATEVSAIAAVCRASVVSVDYRLAPEHPHPAALNDIVTVFDALVRSGTRADRIVFWGDSAGGGLAAAALLLMRDLGMRPAAGAALYSPWADLRNVAASYTENEHADRMFSHDAAERAAALYAGDSDRTSAYVSPALGDWRDCPPLLIQVGDIEVLRDDARLLAKAAASAGVDVDLRIREGRQHLWHLESSKAGDQIAEELGPLAEFINRVAGHAAEDLKPRGRDAHDTF